MKIHERDLGRLQSMLSVVPKHLGLPQVAAILAIASEPSMSVNDLADRLGTPQQTASRHVALLLGRYQDPLGSSTAPALIEQRISEEDPRRRALFLNAAGEKAVLAMVAAIGSSAI